MRNLPVAGICAAMLALLSAATAQQVPATAFQVHQLTPDVYWVEGGGGNSGIVVGNHGVIVIDAKMTPAGGKELLEDVAKITPKPVTTVILTHSDIDHIGGLAAFPTGLTIIAHKNDLKEQEEALKKGGRGAPSPDHLPSRTISSNKEDLTIDGVRFELLHWAPAHTSGDLVVFLPAEKIVFTGDIITTTFHGPLIHQAKGGTSLGWIASTKGILGLDATRFVPGHGDVQDKAEIRKRLSDAETERVEIKKLVAKGESLQQVEAAVGDPAPGAVGGQGPHFPSYSEVVYRELTDKAN